MPSPRRSAIITPAQIKLIHVLKNALGMDEQAYRSVLALYGVTTSKALSFSGAAELIEDLEKKALAIGKWRRQLRPTRATRIGFASVAQVALIERLWDEVSTAPEEGRKAALRRFVARQAKVSDLRFLRDGDASKVICALQAMKRQRAEREFA